MENIYKRYHCCEDMERQLNDSRVPIRYVAMFREYRVLELCASQRFKDHFTPKDPIHFGLTIVYCPWCGVKLPDSLFSVWQETLMQIAPHEDGCEHVFQLDSVPKEFLSDTWWLSRGL